MGSEGKVRPPLFARLLVRLRQREPPEHLAYRRELLSGLSDRVLDLGAGDGANFPVEPPARTARCPARAPAPPPDRRA